MWGGWGAGRVQCIEFEQVWVMGTIRDVYFNTSSAFINCAFSSTSICFWGVEMRRRQVGEISVWKLVRNVYIGTQLATGCLTFRINGENEAWGTRRQNAQFATA